MIDQLNDLLKVQLMRRQQLEIAARTDPDAVLLEQGVRSLITALEDAIASAEWLNARAKVEARIHAEFGLNPGA